jgi:hypothetical protein
LPIFEHQKLYFIRNIFLILFAISLSWFSCKKKTVVVLKPKLVFNYLLQEWIKQRGNAGEFVQNEIVTLNLKKQNFSEKEKSKESISS